MARAIKFIYDHSSTKNSDIKLGMSFMKRDESPVLNAFREFKLERTNF